METMTLRELREYQEIEELKKVYSRVNQSIENEQIIIQPYHKNNYAKVESETDYHE